MKKLLLGGAAAAILAFAPAFAQPAPPPAPGIAQGTAAPPMAPPHVQIQVQDRMTLRTETRDEVVRHVRDMFARLDTNRDGFITREEADAGHPNMVGNTGGRQRLVQRGDFPHPDRSAIFDRLDANKDGSISRQEFMAAQPQIEQHRVFVMRGGPDGAPGVPGSMGMRIRGMGMHGRMFETADANRDGRVSLQEMTAAALRHFDEADANRDGKLTPEERMQMHQRFKGQRPRPS